MVASTVLALAPLIVGGSALVLNEGVGRLPALGVRTKYPHPPIIMANKGISVEQLECLSLRHHRISVSYRGTEIHRSWFQSMAPTNLNPRVAEPNRN